MTPQQAIALEQLIKVCSTKQCIVEEESESEQAGLFDTGRRKLRPTVTIVDTEGRL